MTETAFAAAFARAGIDPAKDLLANFAFDLLRETDTNQAARRLAYQFETHPDWYTQALEEVRNHDNLRLQVALYYLERRRLDMRGKVDGGQAKLASNGQRTHAPATKGMGQQHDASNGQIRGAHSSSSSDRTDGLTGGASNGQVETAVTDRDRPAPLGASRAMSDSPDQRAFAPAAPASSKTDRQRNANLRAGERMGVAVLTALQTKLRDGVVYGDVRMAHLRERARGNRFEAILCEKTLAHVGGRWPDGAFVRDCLSEQVAERLIAEARLEVETVHAA